MKKIIISLLLVLSTAIACGCAKEPQTFDLAAYDFEQTIFTYDGKSYDMTSEALGVNAVTSATAVGGKIVVECHVNPYNNVYGIFDAASGTFETFLTGCNLVWHSEDITTAVYNFWGDVMTYDGNTIKSYTLNEGEFIYEMSFGEDNTKLNVTISGADEDVVDIIELK